MQGGWRYCPRTSYHPEIGGCLICLGKLLCHNPSHPPISAQLQMGWAHLQQRKHTLAHMARCPARVTHTEPAGSLC